MNFAKKLTGWYEHNKRNLPWRQTRDPYKIWLSEIIMQQTRIDQGMDYYIKFIDHYPNIFTLSSATEQNILKLWQGLGYYSRARNLHQTAKKIVAEFNGHFPDNYNDLLKLKGIGEYTAAAVSSISFNEPCPVVDGNVKRFISRMTGLTAPVDSISGKKQITSFATTHIDRLNPGTFNQAMMEFGALYCIPKNPDCIHCIFKSDCEAYKKGQVNIIPVKSKKPIQHRRYFYYLVIIFQNKSVYLNQRTGDDIWKNLYDFPYIEKKKKSSLKNIREEFRLKFGIPDEILQNVFVSKEYKHILTHQILTARFFIVKASLRGQIKIFKSKDDGTRKLVKLTDLHQYPVPKLIENFLENNLFI